jgi:hypothetical protein
MTRKVLRLDDHDRKYEAKIAEEAPTSVQNRDDLVLLLGGPFDKKKIVWPVSIRTNRKETVWSQEIGVGKEIKTVRYWLDEDGYVAVYQEQ